MTVTYQNHTITIYRNRQKANTNRFTMSATFTVYGADIQPSSPLRQQLAPDRYGAVYDGFVDSSIDIKEGDQVYDDNGKVYSVRGVETWTGGGGFADLDHIFLTLIALDA